MRSPNRMDERPPSTASSATPPHTLTYESQGKGPEPGSLSRLASRLCPVSGLFNRERAKILAEILRIDGLMPVLMKPRNGLRWTRQDVAWIRRSLKAVTSFSAFLMVFLVPGTFIVLPILAWWLDRRRHRRTG